MNINSLIDEKLKETPDKICIVDTKYALTYKTLFNEVNRLSNALSRLGLKKGDRVAFIDINSCASVVFCLALLRLGSVFVPIDSGFDEKKIRKILYTIQPDLLILGRNCEKIISYKNAKSDFAVFVSIYEDIPDAIGYSDLVRNVSSEFSSADLKYSDPCAIVFTNSQENSFRSVGGILEFMEEIDLEDVKDDADPSCLINISVSNSISFCAVLSNLRHGIKSVFSDTFSAVSWADLVESEHITTSILSPWQLQDISVCTDIYGKDLPSMHNIRIIGDELSAAIIKDAFDILPGHVNISNLYYTTESFLITKMTWTSALLEQFSAEDFTKLYSVGKVSLKEGISIDNNTGLIPKNRWAGEITLKKPAAFLGYINSFSHKVIPFENEWFHTDDIGYIDGEGYLYYIGRRHEILPKNDRACVQTRFMIPLNYNRSGTILLQHLDFYSENLFLKDLVKVQSFAINFYSALDTAQLKEKFLNDIPEIITADAYSIMLLSEEKDNALTDKLLPESNAAVTSYKWHRTRLDVLLGHMSGRAQDNYSSGVYVEDLFPAGSSLIFSKDIRYVITFPIMGPNRIPMCNLSFGRSEESGDFSSREINILQMFSNFFSLAVKNALEYSQLKKDNELLRDTRDEAIRKKGPEDFNVTLTAREREIFDLILMGRSNSDICSELFIEMSTAKFHVKNILKKFDVSSRSQLLALLYNGENPSMD